tara:strand:- start:362 stop:1192 length:831 start_codon:yes stop_codon:yes gene_type:complete
MKTTNRLISAIAVLLLLLNSTTILAQDEAATRPQYVVITTMHWNMDNDDFKMDEWKAVEKEYLDNVTKKNEHVMAAGFYLHRITPDNTELIYVQAYKDWNSIDLAAERDDELAKETWTDDGKRKAFFKKQMNYYDDYHSDEIYATMAGAKPLSEDPTEDMIVYIRTSHFAFPKDGTTKEFTDTFSEYTEHVTHKNEYVKAYYPMSHAYGSDKTQFIEAYFLNSLADLDKKFDKDGELFDAHWSDEKAKKEMGDKGGKYFTGVHGDAVYTVVPELRK